MDGRGEPQWQPISRLPLLTQHLADGVKYAEDSLALFAQARGSYRLSNADVAGIVKTFTQSKADLVELYVEQGRRWQALELGATRRKDVQRFVDLVAEELRLVEQILALAEQLKTWTIEAMLAKSDEQLGLEALLGG